MKETILSYDNVENAIETLVANMEEENYTPKCLVAICRGGLFPTLILSEMLGIRDIKSVTLYSYNDNKQQHEIQILNSDTIEDSEGTLFVDDLYDSGQTIALIDKMYPKSKKAVVYTKKDSLHLPLNYIGEELYTDNWLVFPWEK